MQKKLALMVFSLCVMVSLCFAQDVKPAADAKPAKIEMSKIPELDPKTWDFLPDVVATVGNSKITKADLVKVLNP